MCHKIRIFFGECLSKKNLSCNTKWPRLNNLTFRSPDAKATNDICLPPGFFLILGTHLLWCIFVHNQWISHQFIHSLVYRLSFTAILVSGVRTVAVKTDSWILKPMEWTFMAPTSKAFSSTSSEASMLIHLLQEFLSIGCVYCGQQLQFFSQCEDQRVQRAMSPKFQQSKPECRTNVCP